MSPRTLLFTLLLLASALPARAADTVPIEIELTGIRCKPCVDEVLARIKRFPEITKTEIDIKKSRAYLTAAADFDQYVALQHSIEEAGGAIHMFDVKYVVPRAYYAMLGVRGRDADKAEKLQAKLDAVPGVRSTIIDRERWFVNEDGLDVGGVVIFADPNPKLDFLLTQAGKDAGYILELRNHGGGHGGGPTGDREEWSEMNHAFAGLCLLLLTVIGVLQLSLKQPPAFIKYGSVVVWGLLFVFLFIRSDRSSWPLGKIGWFEGFQEWETAQHRIGQLLILLIAIGDFMRIRSGWKANPTFSRWGVLALGVVGAGMLYSHLHVTIDPAHYREVARMNFQHILMATAALLFCLSKFVWETWRIPRAGGQYVWLGFLGALGLILCLYVE